MRKQKSSKLDPFADRLEQWFTPKDKGGDGLTLEQARSQLKLDGCPVSASRLSGWWEARQSQKQQAALLGQITSGARQCQEIEKQFAKNPAPQLETIIKLHRVMIMRLATQSADNPELFEIMNALTKTVMEFVSGQTKAALKERELSLAEERFKESLRTKLESAFAELATACKGNAEALQHIQKARALIAPEKPK